MNERLFAELIESMTQMNEILRGKRAPSRAFHVDAVSINALRSKLALTKPKIGPRERRRGGRTTDKGPRESGATER